MSNQYSVKDMAHVCSDKDKEIRELQAQVAKMRKALEEIKAVRYGLEPSTDEHCADYWSRLAQSYRDLAREALKDLPPT